MQPHNYGFLSLWYRNQARKSSQFDKFTFYFMNTFQLDSGTPSLCEK